MTIDTLSPVANETTAGQIERQLREAIVRLELLPGARLSEQDLATRFGVSRQPVREALIALAKTRLVDIRPNRGTVVTLISVQGVREARFVREAVEVAVVRRACQSFDLWTREILDSNLEQQAAAVETDNHILFRQLDSQFHINIAKGAGCELALGVIADMKAHMDRACNLTLQYPHARSSLYDHHAAIVEAIDRRDPEAAEGIMRDHLQTILIDLPQVEAEHAELFES